MAPWCKGPFLSCCLPEIPVIRPLALSCLSLSALGAFAGQACAAPIPEPVAAMIDVAARDPAQLTTVAAIARITYPDSIAEIDARVAAIRAGAERQRVATLSDQAFREGWSGQGQAGGSISTGNTEAAGLVVGLDLKKESLRWRHRLNAVVDHQTSNSVQTRERYRVGYEGDYKFSERLYANLLVSWERDPFAGFEGRTSESAGIGYRFLTDGAMTLDADIGVAARQTRFVNAADESTLGGRLGLRYEWKLTPDTVFTEVASTYLDGSGTTVESTTAITTRLSGKLSGRASLNVRYDSDPPIPREATDTATQFSLVYGF